MFEKCPICPHISVREKSKAVHIQLLYIPGRHIWGEEV
jgi:hypothetical protein